MKHVAKQQMRAKCRQQRWPVTVRRTRRQWSSALPCIRCSSWPNPPWPGTPTAAQDCAVMHIGAALLRACFFSPNRTRQAAAAADTPPPGHCSGLPAGALRRGRSISHELTALIVSNCTYLSAILGSHHRSHGEENGSWGGSCAGREHFRILGRAYLAALQQRSCVCKMSKMDSFDGAVSLNTAPALRRA
jgi:hypothetical protein